MIDLPAGRRVRVSSAVPRERVVPAASPAACSCSAHCPGAFLFPPAAATQLHGLPDGNAELVSARLSAVRLCLFHRQHAQGDPSLSYHGAGALLRHDLERRVSEGRGLPDRCGSKCLMLAIYAGIVFLARCRAKCGRRWPDMWERISRNHSQRIPPGVARAAHAQHAVHAAAGATARLWIRGQSGCGPRPHGLDGSGPHVREPRFAGRVFKARAASTWWPCPPTNDEVQQVARWRRRGLRGARAAGLRARHHASRPQHGGAGAGGWHQFQYRVARFELRQLPSSRTLPPTSCQRPESRAADGAPRSPGQCMPRFRKSNLRSRVWFNPDSAQPQLLRARESS